MYCVIGPDGFIVYVGNLDDCNDFADEIGGVVRKCDDGDSYEQEE